MDIIGTLRIVIVVVVLVRGLWLLGKIWTLEVGQTTTLNVIEGSVFWLLFKWFLPKYKGGPHREGFKIRRESE